MDNKWRGVTYGNDLFVAVAETGTGNRMLTSQNCINWTYKTSAADNAWTSVTYGNCLFVAVFETGTGNRVMTSGYYLVADATVITTAPDNQTEATISFTQPTSVLASAITNYRNWTTLSPVSTS